MLALVFEVQPVAPAVVDPQFRHAVANRLHVAAPRIQACVIARCTAFSPHNCAVEATTADASSATLERQTGCSASRCRASGPLLMRSAIDDDSLNALVPSADD
jgi:hypothetical protein